MAIILQRKICEIWYLGEILDLKNALPFYALGDYTIFFLMG